MAGGDYLEVDKDLKKGIVYEIPCGYCSQVYIGDGQESEGEEERASVCSQEEGYEEWDCSTCLPTTTQCGLGWSQSEVHGATSLEMKGP